MATKADDLEPDYDANGDAVIPAAWLDLPDDELLRRVCDLFGMDEETARVSIMVRRHGGDIEPVDE